MALARAVNEKQPVPEIDFSLHQMEDGTQVSTMERVVKGKVAASYFTDRNLITNNLCLLQRSKRQL